MIPRTRSERKGWYFVDPSEEAVFGLARADRGSERDPVVLLGSVDSVEFETVIVETPVWRVGGEAVAEGCFC